MSEKPQNNEIFYTPSGEKVIKTYQEVIDKDTGYTHLEETGETNIYEKIQSFKDETDLHKIMERCAYGDYSGLQARQTSYGDFTNINKSINEINQIQRESQRAFDNLTAEEQQKVLDIINGTQKQEEKVETQPQEETKKGVNYDE